MSDPFVSVAEFPDPYKANSALARLQEAGIAAYLTGGMTADSMMGYIGMGRQIQLLVARSDAKRAADILSTLDEGQEMPSGWEDDFPAEEGYWICSQCDEAIEEQVDVCPWCGSARSERDAFESP